MRGGKMGRTALTKISLEFEKEYKEIIHKLLNKEGMEDNIFKEGEGFIYLEFYDTEYEEEDIKNLKPYCDYIYIDNYERCDYESVYWENEDDELQKVVKQKLNKMDKK